MIALASGLVDEITVAVFRRDRENAEEEEYMVAVEAMLYLVDPSDEKPDVQLPLEMPAEPQEQCLESNSEASVQPASAF